MYPVTTPVQVRTPEGQEPHAREGQAGAVVSSDNQADAYQVRFDLDNVTETIAADLVKELKA
jgi:hypothetical protein